MQDTSMAVKFHVALENETLQHVLYSVKINLEEDNTIMKDKSAMERKNR